MIMIVPRSMHHLATYLHSLQNTLYLPQYDGPGGKSKLNDQDDFRNLFCLHRFSCRALTELSAEAFRVPSVGQPGGSMAIPRPPSPKSRRPENAFRPAEFASRMVGRFPLSHANHLDVQVIIDFNVCGSIKLQGRVELKVIFLFVFKNSNVETKSPRSRLLTEQSSVFSNSEWDSNFLMRPLKRNRARFPGIVSAFSADLHQSFFRLKISAADCQTVRESVPAELSEIARIK